MNIMAIALLLISLAGCAAPKPEYKLERTTANVKVHVVERIPGRSQAYGLSACREGDCEIWIRRSVYPNCLVHEMRHAFEGDFHKGRESIEDCL